MTVVESEPVLVEESLRSVLATGARPPQPDAR